MSTLTASTALADQLAAFAEERGIEITELDDLTIHVEMALNRFVADRLEGAVLGDLRAATEARTAAEARWRRLMSDAIALGVPRASIAEAAGVTRQWVSRLAAQNRKDQD